MDLPNQTELLTLFSAYLKEAGLSAVSVKNYLSDLRHFLNFCEIYSTSSSNSGTSATTKEIFELLPKFLSTYVQEQTSTLTPKNTTNRRMASIRRFATFLKVKYDVQSIFSEQSISNTVTNTTHIRQEIRQEIRQSDHFNSTDQTVSPLSSVPSENTGSITPAANILSSAKILEQFKSALEKEKKSRSTIKNYLSDLNHFFLWTANQTPYTAQNLVNILSEPQLQAYITYLKLSHTSTSVINRRQSSIKKLAKFCFTREYIQENPFELKPAPPALAPLAWIERLAHRPKKAPKTVKKGFALIVDRYNGLPWAPYLNIALLVLATTAMAIFAYNQVILRARQGSAATALTPPRRQLSFQGRLTDSGGTPITTAVSVVFKLFNQLAPPGTQLYTSGTCSIDPDQNGIFNTLIGDGVCGAEITQSVFTDNRDVFLEIQVGSETLTPRQQIATVGYALNSETLQGYPASAAATINTVPVIDNNGDINIALTSPSIISTSGVFTLTGQSMALTTAANSGGDIILQPDALGSGQVLVLGGTSAEDTLRVTNANLTTGALISGYVGSDANTGRLLSLTAGSAELDRFWVATNGTTSIQAATESALTALMVNQNGPGDLIAASTSGVNKFVVTRDGNVNITGTYLINGSPFTGTLWQRTSGSLAPLNITDSVNIGATATNSAFVHLAGTSGENSFVNTGSFGIGTTAPDARLEINHATGDNLRLTYNDADGSATAYSDFSLASDGDLTIDSAGGAVSLASGDDFNLTAAGDLIFGGATSLAETTAANDSGAYLVGTFDEFDNSASSTIQAVLKDLDSAISSGGANSIWTDSGTTTYLTDTTDELVLGGTTPISSAKFTIDGDNNQIQLVIQGNATQTTNMVEYQNSTGTAMTGIDDTGRLFANLGTDSSNFFIGLNAGNSTMTGTSNTGIGQVAGISITTGQYNMLIGNSAGTLIQDGTNNTFIGRNTGSSNISASYNTGIGASTLQFTTTSYNTAIGSLALQDASTGQRNTAVGYGAMGNITTSSYNVAIGMLAGQAASLGNQNTIIGYNAGYNNVGASNTIIGHQAGYNSTGSGNVFIGNQAGYSETGDNKLYIDNSSTTTPLIHGDFTSNLLTVNGDASASGHLSLSGDAANYLQLLDGSAFIISTSVGGDTGNADRFTILNSGNVGIGITNPSYKLDVNGDTHVAAGSDYYVGTIGLNDAGTGNTSSGAYLVGTFDEFDNSSSANVQDVLDDLDAAITAGASGTGPWIEGAGILYPKNSTVDLFVGGQASSSAKFAVLNMNSGTPVATMSSSYWTSDGTLSTTARQSLTLGNSSTYNTTGNILLNPNGTGNVGIGTTAPDSLLHLLGTGFDATLRINGGGTSNSLIAFGSAEEAEILYHAASPDLMIFTNTGVPLIFQIGNGEKARLTATGELGLATTAPDARLEINHATGDNLRLTYNDADGSATAYSDFSLASDGDLTIDSAGGAVSLASGDDFNLTAAGDLIFGGATSLAETTAANDSGAYLVGTFDEFDNSSSANVQDVLDDLDAAITAGASGTGPWIEGAGILYPKNSTVDLFVGGQASSSAKFAVLNMNSGTPVATMSSSYWTSDGTLSTTARQSLTLGNSSTYNTTGNILLNPNGTGNVGIGTTAPTYGLDVNNTAAFRNIARFLGTVTQAAQTIDRIDIGVEGGTPRMIFENSGFTIWQIDNDSGTFRWFIPGVEQMNLTTSGNYPTLTLKNGSTSRIVLNTNGSSYFTGGSVAIGATNPLTKLMLTDSTNPKAFLLGFRQSTDNTYGFDISLEQQSVGRLDFDTLNASTRATAMSIMRNTGLVGMGTNAPDARLEINHATGDNLRLTYNDADGSATAYSDFSLASDGDLTIDSAGGAVSLASGDDFNLTAAGDLIFGGATSLAETTAANDSGAYLVGTFDEFDNSSSANVQDVLDDLDAAITSGTLWQRTSGSLAPLYITDSLNLGATATGSATVHLSGTTGDTSFFKNGVALGFTTPITSIPSHTTMLEVAGDINPNADASYDIGRTGAAWQNIYLASGIHDSAGVEIISTSNRRLANGMWNINDGIRVGDTTQSFPNGEKLYVTGNATITGSLTTGSLGIGTTTPTSDFDIAGNASTSGTFSFRGTTDPKINVLNGENFGIQTSVGGDTGLTERFTILNTGNVGIGITNPAYKLDVTGTTHITSTVTLDSLTADRLVVTDGSKNLVSSITSANMAASITNETGTGLAVFNDSPAFTTQIVSPVVIGSTSANGTLTLEGNNTTGNTAGNANLIFKVGDSAGTTAMTILNNGSIGIGTTTPFTGLTGYNGLEVITTGNNLPRGLLTTQYSTDANSAILGSRKARGSAGSLTTVVNGDTLFTFYPQAYDGANWVNPGLFGWLSNGTVATNSIPSDFVLYTGAVSGGSERMRITSAGDVGFGITNPGAKVDIVGNSTNTASAFYALQVSGAQSTANTASHIGGNFIPTYTAASGNTLANLSGVRSIPSNTNTGTVTALYGINSLPTNSSSGTVTSLYGLSGVPQKTGTGAVTSAYGVYARVDNDNATGTISNAYGVYIGDSGETGTITNDYGLYQNDTTADNYFAGSVGIGITNPSVLLTVGNGSGADGALFSTGTGQFTVQTARTSGVNSQINWEASSSLAGTAYGLNLTATNLTTGANLYYGLYVQDPADAGAGTATGLNLVGTNWDVDIAMQNGETIDNNTNGQITLSTGIGTTTNGVYIDSGNNATTNGLCQGGTNSNTSLSNIQIVACSAAPTSDYSEIYPTKPDVVYGDIVAISPQTTIIRRVQSDESGNVLDPIPQSINILQKSLQPYQTNVVGIASQNWTDFTSAGHNSVKDEDHPLPIALNGRVVLNISNSSAPIKAGDQITTSEDPGKGMKALQSGRIVGTALEDWSPNNNQTQILVFVDNSYHDPDVAINDSGDVSLHGDSLADNFTVTTPTGITSKIGAFAQATVAYLKAGSAVVTDLIAQNLTVRGKLISPIADIDQLKVIDATVSGTLYANNIKSGTIDALTGQLDLLNDKYSTASAILTDLQAKYGTYDSLLNTPTATGSSDPLALSPLATTSATVPYDLALNSLDVQTILTGDILASGSIFSSSLSSLDTDLFIQPLGDKPVHLLANLMTLYPDGKVVVNGDLLVTGTLYANNLDTKTATVSGTLALGRGELASDSGKLIALFNDQGQVVGSVDSSGSASFGQLTTDGLVIAAGNDTSSATVSAQANSNATIGTAGIATGSAEIFIGNNKVTDNTLVYITPISNTDNQVLYVKSKQSGIGFTVATPQVTTNEIFFNYWLVQTK